MNEIPLVARDHLQDRTMEVETPELVSIEYPLAGLGSRFAALFADLIVAGLIFLGITIGVFLLVFALRDGGEFISRWILVPLYIFSSFAIFWGYFFFQEAFRDGQTIGKRWMGIRVVMDGGYPITVEAAAIRNLVRIIDLLGGGLLGGCFMLLSSRSKRLGDMAASTVVVRELSSEFPEVSEHAGTAGPPRIADSAFQALETYADRSSSLEPVTRRRLALTMSTKLHAIEPPLAGESPESYLLRFHAEEGSRRRAAQRGDRGGSAAAVSLLRAKRSRWVEFRDIVSRLRRNRLASLGEEGVGDFAARYRELTADLARARTYGGSAGTIFALERLVGAGHNLFYRPARRTLRGILRWLTGGFPALVRKNWLPILAASVFLYVPGLVSYFLILYRPEMERQLVPAEMIARAEEAPGRRASGVGYIDVPISHSFLASAIIANNIQVSFLAFALGVTAGVGTALILVINGLHLGSALGVFQNRGVLDLIGIFVLPHGVIELTAIAIAGGAGLWMGSGLLLPGQKTRRAAFTERAREAVSLIAGVILLLLVAGLIEGFISPARIPSEVKLSVAAVAAAALASYLLTAGRSQHPRAPPASRQA